MLTAINLNSCALLHEGKYGNMRNKLYIYQCFSVVPVAVQTTDFEPITEAEKDCIILLMLL